MKKLIAICCLLIIGTGTYLIEKAIPVPPPPLAWLSIDKSELMNATDALAMNALSQGNASWRLRLSDEGVWCGEVFHLSGDATTGACQHDLNNVTELFAPGKFAFRVCFTRQMPGPDAFLLNTSGKQLRWLYEWNSSNAYLETVMFSTNNKFNITNDDFRPLAAPRKRGTDTATVQVQRHR